ncbi:hypothetical protein ACFOLJ_28050 [Rugamonas sp. CCM 8940]|uniref:hypothetical protein n=1 Tax=Rugamonas sp. CCM 8940 TaxID=2765359 RepID=UPI0018F4D27E|nr:hypothetical protein [Rugamonas sp. CCM 8940]MBJ7312049.1 hypothetical protein [Rugamonas sp. CCM 8940]
MISKEGAPVGWSALMYELEDAQEHLARLISEMNKDPEYDEESFRMDLGHVFSHLNRAWNWRNEDVDIDEENWQRASQFPVDLDPV